MPSAAFNPEDLSRSLKTNVIAVQCVGYLCLALLVWDWLAGIKFEIKHIWRQSPSYILKWQYLFARYAGIIVQMIHAIVTTYIYVAGTVPRRLCDGWYFTQMLTSHLLLFPLETHLIHRVYGLYHSSGYGVPLVVFLSILVAAENSAAIFFGIESLRDVGLDEKCVVEQAPQKMIWISAAIGVVQTILWTLTVYMSRKKGVPMLNMMFRDGSWVFGATSIVLIGTAVEIAISEDSIFNPYPIFMGMITYLSCRMIVNLAKFPLDQDDGSVEMTSFIDVLDYIASSESNEETSEKPNAVSLGGTTNVGSLSVLSVASSVTRESMPKMIRESGTSEDQPSRTINPTELPPNNDNHNP